MRIDIYGLAFDGPGITFYLWSPWRCSALEHRLFESIRAIQGVEMEQAPDELRLHVTDPKICKAAFQLSERVLKGWQEESSEGNGERRLWRWMIEADADSHGYDHAGEKASNWGFLRLLLERTTPEGDRPEEIDLNGFGFRVWRADEENERG